MTKLTKQCWLECNEYGKNLFVDRCLARIAEQEAELKDYGETVTHLREEIAVLESGKKQFYSYLKILAENFHADLAVYKTKYDDCFEQLGVKSLAELVGRYDTQIEGLKAELVAVNEWLGRVRSDHKALWHRLEQGPV
jgi:prefoldin subunit 5